MPSIAPRTIVILAVLAFVVAMVVGRLNATPGSGSSSGGDRSAGASSPAAPLSALTPVATASLVVDVVGAVRHAGVYRLADGARVREAIAAAGGLAPGADRLAVNLAARVADGEQVLVPTRGTRPAGAVAGAPRPDAPVSLNAAAAVALETLPGIGPAMARRIVAWRLAHGPFPAIDRLVDVPGIGPRLLARIRGRLTL